MGAQRQAVKALSGGTWGQLAGWIKSPWGTPMVRDGQKKGNHQDGASSEDKLEPVTPQTPRAKVHADPTGKAAVPNPARICEWGGAPGLVTAAALTSDGISGRGESGSRAKFSNRGRSQITVCENGEKPSTGWRRRTKHVCDTHPLAHRSDVTESLLCERPRGGSGRWPPSSDAHTCTCTCNRAPLPREQGSAEFQSPAAGHCTPTL